MSDEIGRIDFDETEIISNLIIDGKYRIIKKLAQGGMGAVFVAEQMSVQRQVALKVISTTYMESPSAITRFFQEAEILANLQHSTIVKLIDFGRAQDSSLYIVMELLKGQTLDDHVRENGPLSVDSVIALGVQISSAMVEFHSKQIVHRDIKPGNIFVKQTIDEMFTVKLIDFGLGKEMRRTGEKSNPGEVLGSPMYMAPEQIQGEPTSELSDIHSLGLTLYFALTGKPPFQSGSLSETLHEKLTDVPRPIHHLRVDLHYTDDIVRIIDRCIDNEQENRFGNSLSLLRAFRKAQSNLDTPDEPLFTEEIGREKFRDKNPNPVPAPPDLSFKKKVVAIIIQVGLALVAILLLGYIIYSFW